MKYLIGSSVSTDEIQFHNHAGAGKMLGGAGFYAYAGLRVWDDEVLMLSGIGSEYLAWHGQWYRDNGLSVDGFVVRSEKTPITHITYFADGDRVDRPDMGLAEFRRLDATIEEIEQWCDGDTKGVYVFKHMDTAFMERLIQLRDKYGFKLMWEIAEDAAIPANRAVIESYLPFIDVFSINRKEAAALFETTDVQRITKLFQELTDHWVFFRQGALGAYMIAQGKTYFAPSVRDAEVVDPTGGGNSSSGGVLYACCEGMDPLMATVIGNVTASLIIRQYGPPERYDAELRNNAIRLADQLYKECDHNA